MSFLLRTGTILGDGYRHSDIILTLGTYSHVLPVMQDEAAEKIDELLTPFNVSDELKKLGEGKSSYSPTNQNLIKAKAREQNGELSGSCQKKVSYKGDSFFAYICHIFA